MRTVVTIGIALVLAFSVAIVMAAEEKTDIVTGKKPVGLAETDNKAVDKMEPAADEAAEAEKPESAPAFVPKGDLERGSYAAGVSLGRTIKIQETDLDITAFLAGIKAAVTGEKLALTDNELREATMKFKTRMMAKQRLKQNEIARKNAEEGAAFLQTNAQKEGVVTLPSGLQYKIIKDGDGPSPRATDRVITHYRGTFIDGTEFDSSYGRGKPATFGVNGVIKGWTEALQLMKVGSKWQLFVPSELAYGARGYGQAIGPNSTLIFEVELLGIEG